VHAEQREDSAPLGISVLPMTPRDHAAYGEQDNLRDERASRRPM
jgi:hypothetical protein